MPVTKVVTLISDKVSVAIDSVEQKEYSIDSLITPCEVRTLFLFCCELGFPVCHFGVVSNTLTSVSCYIDIGAGHQFPQET